MARKPKSVDCEATASAHQVTAREGAMLIAHLVERKSAEARKQVTRCRLTEMTLRSLLQRKLITPEFLIDVQNWLFQAGWVLFFAGESYALVRLSVVNAWMRIGSKRITIDLKEVARGTFEFQALENLLVEDEGAGNGADGEEE